MSRRRIASITDVAEYQLCTGCGVRATVSFGLPWGLVRSWYYRSQRIVFQRSSQSCCESVEPFGGESSPLGSSASPTQWPEPPTLWRRCRL
jgi:hypothetical protein